MPDLVIGNPPRGDDYFGQDGLIETIWSRLKKNNVLLVAPRRFGKTGAMYRLLDYPRDEFMPIYLDVESVNSAADFMVELIAKLIKKHRLLNLAQSVWKETKELGEFIRTLSSSIDLGGLKVEIREKTDIQKKWLDYGEQIKALLIKESKSLLLILDEFPIMMNNILSTNYEEAKQLLYWFRGVRIAPESKTRFVIGGSINLESTLVHSGLVDTINDISIIKLQAFSIETAKKFIEAIFVSRGIEVKEEVKDTILEMIGEPIPYLLAVLLTAILDRIRIHKCDITPKLVKEAFDEDLLGGSTSVVFQHYRSRIDQYPYYSEMEKKSAKVLLGMLSKADKPVKKDTLYHAFLKTGNFAPGLQAREDFMRLMNKLDNDFYLVQEDDKFTFYSRVLKMWWKTNYGWY